MSDSTAADRWLNALSISVDWSSIEVRVMVHDRRMHTVGPRDRPRNPAFPLVFRLVAAAALAAATGTASTAQATQPMERPALVPVEGPPPWRRVASFVLAPAWLSVGFVRLDAEVKLAQKWGCKAAMGTFADFRWTDNVLGAQVNYYFWGRFERGWQVGLEYVAGRKRGLGLFVGSDRGEVESSSRSMLRIALAGPHVGYKYIAQSGLTIELQLGVHGAWVRRYVDGQQLDSSLRALPVVATNFGWSI